MSNSLKTLSQEMLAALDQEMRLVLQANGQQPSPFYGMIHYHMGWADTTFQADTVNRGKQIRPLLCLLACQAAGGDWRQALPAAAAIEILHNFSLVHDDIEDASPTRRGRDTVWSIWGQAQAINTGDAMFALAHLALNRLIERGVDAIIVIRALRRFDETCVHLTQGQHLDMNFETRATVSTDEYIEMITGKTAVLLSLATELGALIAGQPDTIVAHYAAFGLNLGLAFQVIDDILGIWGDEALIGKSVATDITTKKKTLPVLYALAQDETLVTLYNEAEPDDAFVHQVVKRLNEAGARDYSTNKASHYTQQATTHLAAAQPSGDGLHALQALTNKLLNRNF